MKKPLAVIVVRRQLTSLRTGANVYLSVLLRELRAAGFSIRLVFAPESSFGGRPVATVGADFLNLCDDISWPGTLRAGRFFLSLAPRVYWRFLRRMRRELRRLLGTDISPRLGRVSERLPEREAHVTAEVIDSHSPRLVIAEYSTLGPLLDRVRTPKASKAVLLHDLFSLRARAMRAIQRPVDFAELTLEEEAAYCRAADMLVYASHAELEAFRPLLPGRTHLWLAPHRDNCLPIAPSGHPKALFIGVRHSGNLDALHFLMEEIWPRVVALKPDAELYIAGEISLHLRSDWRRLPGVKVLGIVDDLTSLGGADTIGLAPTRVASGISIKIADYMCLGTAVLASRIAIEGYGSVLNDVVETAECAEDFATQLASLLSVRDKRHALARCGRQEGLARLSNEITVRCLCRGLQGEGLLQFTIPIPEDAAAGTERSL